MYCSKCGGEIVRENSKFCPKCGVALKVTEQTIIENASEDKTQEMTAKPKSKKSPARFIAAGIGAILLIALVVVGINHVRSRIIRNSIYDATTKVMDSVKTGLTEEGGSQVSDYVKQRFLNNYLNSDKLLVRTLASIVEKGIDSVASGEIYEAMVYCMNYEVIEVREVSSTHYTATVYVENVKVKMVSKDVVSGVGDYLVIAAGVLSGKTDEVLADLLSEYKSRAKAVYEARDPNYLVSGTYTIDFVKKNGEWVLDSQSGIFGTGMDLISTCWGFES